MPFKPSQPVIKWVIVPLLVLLVTTVGYLLYQGWNGTTSRNRKVVSWIRNPQDHPDWLVAALTRCNSSTPFLFPTDGYIGYLWGDSFRPGHHHQGIDIFTRESAGETPVFAAYDGFLTRLPSWKSSLIIRIPQDPLHPGRQIWIYYTHLADIDGNSYINPSFPSGSIELPVEEGTLLGYQGNFSVTPGHPVGVHLHFSIVLDDGQGTFLNELNIKNTLDPSPYFDLQLNGHTNKDSVPFCEK